MTRTIDHESFSSGRNEPGMLYLCLLRACSKNKDLCAGTRSHAEILQNGLFEKNLDITRSLLSMYAKCHEFRKVEALLYELAHRDVFLGIRSNDALKLFNQMRLEDCPPDKVTFTSILKACSTLRDLSMEKKIHDYVARRGLVSKDIILATTLLNMYVNCGVLRKAQKVLDELPSRDSFCWTTIIKGYIGIGQYEYALKCFKRMRDEDISPDTVTFTCVLKACASIGALDKGSQIHDEILGKGLTKTNQIVGNASKCGIVHSIIGGRACSKNKDLCASTRSHAEILQNGLFEKNLDITRSLLSMYAKCHEFRKAEALLYELAHRDVFLGIRSNDALKLFNQMWLEDCPPDKVTFTSILKACSTLRDLSMEKKIHDYVARRGLVSKDIILATTLLNMYVNCGVLRKAQKVLDELPSRDSFCWTTIIKGYIGIGQYEYALKCFKQMRDEDISPDTVTFTCVLKACASIGALDKGSQIHDEILGKGLTKTNQIVGNASKCGIVHSIIGGRGAVPRSGGGKSLILESHHGGWIHQGWYLTSVQRDTNFGGGGFLAAEGRVWLR
ncbi:hypothetical protein KP509_23G002500 [Ceratopteris richardii]|uniref:Pentatricopeptide repeat-containing protein n=1 Tax=Ceratopteris richardii TaxID=49495 RepID=A0A8T2RZQ8_CERRI|nr:hypothetical protein KP509_23G002500 [Ceratopteris richardii]